MLIMSNLRLFRMNLMYTSGGKNAGIIQNDSNYAKIQ